MQRRGEAAKDGLRRRRLSWGWRGGCATHEGHRSYCLRLRRCFAIFSLLDENMAKQALAVLESALRVRKLDRTLTTALPPLQHADPASVSATSLAVLDACLQGGLPRGQLSEMAGARSSGVMTLMLQMMAASTRRGEIAA